MRVLAALLLAFASGCAHQRLAAQDLDRVKRPAFISRIEHDAGPRARVFREDPSYRAKLKKLGVREADRRLAAKLAQGATRFAVADRLRGGVQDGLPALPPWDAAVEPARVATALETFLVEEVPADPPDYELLRAFGTDAVVEFVIDEFGMRSEGGRAGVYIRGSARMFRLDGQTLWRAPFLRDEVAERAEHLDPFLVGQRPHLFGERVAALINAVAERLVAELNPPGRTLARPPRPHGSGELSDPPDDSQRTGRERPPPAEPELPPGELPPPD